VDEVFLLPRTPQTEKTLCDFDPFLKGHTKNPASTRENHSQILTRNFWRFKKETFPKRTELETNSGKKRLALKEE
jgi:hypothetical protein